MWYSRILLLTQSICNSLIRTGLCLSQRHTAGELSRLRSTPQHPDVGVLNAAITATKNNSLLLRPLRLQKTTTSKGRPLPKNPSGLAVLSITAQEASESGGRWDSQPSGAANHWTASTVTQTAKEGQGLKKLFRNTRRLFHHAWLFLASLGAEGRPWRSNKLCGD